MKLCYLFDIDGTVANLAHRLHHIQKDPKDWDSFFDDVAGDTPITAVCMLLRCLHRDATYNSGFGIVYASGRSDRTREATLGWLKMNALPYEAPLYMRKDGDHRPDYQVKKEILQNMRDDGYEPIMAFDDRNQVVAMWRDCGVPCAQVAPGDF